MGMTDELTYYAGENYVLCYFASAILFDSFAIGDIAYDSMWYAMQSREQYIIQIIIHRSQNPVELNGFGIITCSLEAYMKVIFGRRRPNEMTKFILFESKNVFPSFHPNRWLVVPFLITCYFAV